MEDVWGTVDGDGDGDGDDGGRRRGYNMAPPPPYLKRGRWSTPWASRRRVTKKNVEVHALPTACDKTPQCDKINKEAVPHVTKRIILW